jgi:hypothetical protein
MNFRITDCALIEKMGQQPEAPYGGSMRTGTFVRAAVIAGVMMLAFSTPDSFSISKYLIQGVVLDDQGAPVEGAALHIGRQLSYTNSSGRFMVRFSKPGSFPLSLAPEEFLTNGVYQVVSAPAQVQAESEDSVSDVRVVVRRVPPPQARLYNQ